MGEDYPYDQLFVNRNLSVGHLQPILISAGVRYMADLGTFWFMVTYDMGASGGKVNFPDSGCTMSTTMSKQYDSFDEAVLAMNDSIAEGPEL